MLLHEGGEVDGRNAEDDARKIALDPGEQRNGVSAERQALYPDAITALCLADPMQEPSDVPNRLRDGMDVVHQILIGETDAER